LAGGDVTPSTATECTPNTRVRDLEVVAGPVRTAVFEEKRRVTYNVVLLDLHKLRAMIDLHFLSVYGPLLAIETL